ncbi:MAG TPA: hypothetical protein IGS37_04920 [Synechococcales cyanobacterium M55_K2018_004]|nr:hypothetical protein [Synechococcales cyanobacterium M55_K2018_004]
MTKFLSCSHHQHGLGSKSLPKAAGRCRFSAALEVRIIRGAGASSALKVDFLHPTLSNPTAARAALTQH